MSDIDRENREMYERRRAERRREDIAKGLTRDSGPQRGDFGLCRRLEKTLADYRTYKNPADREKIKKEYFGLQKESRS